MRREYLGHGMGDDKLRMIELFAPNLASHSARADLSSAEHSLLFVGRMTKLKGGDLLIRAVAKASRYMGRDIHLVMAGDGPQRASWERLARRLKVSAVFTGWVTGDEHSRLLKQATLFAVPSVWPEPFGLVGLEAACAEIPAIAFNVGGISQWLKDGVNGFLVPGNPPASRALAEGLVEAFSDPERLRRMGAAARETALEMSVEKHLDELEEVFRSVSARQANSNSRLAVSR